MTSPEVDGPADVAAVAEWLGANDPEFSDDLVHIEAVVPAVNAYLRAILNRPAGGWGEDVKHGATMLAARNVRRRNSPAGVEAGSDLSGAVYVSRFDRDLDSLLGLGSFRPLIVG